MSKRILVTGSSGTVGTALTLRLRELGFSVIPLDREPSFWDKRIDRATVRHDLCRSLTGKLRGRKPDMIVHLAANARVHELVRHPDRATENYLMTFNILEYARTAGIDRVIFSSSREVYGDSAGRGRRGEKHASPDLVTSPYTASKLSGEALCHAYHRCYGVRSVIVRLSNVYGCYDISERVVPQFFYHALRNETLKIFGSEKRLDFTWIDDTVDGILQIIRKFDHVSGETFNIASGRSNSLVDLCHKIKRLTGSQSEVDIGDRRTGEITTFAGDTALARKLLGFAPKVSLDAGLRRALGWYTDVFAQPAMRKRFLKYLARTR